MNVLATETGWYGGAPAEALSQAGRELISSIDSVARDAAGRTDEIFVKLLIALQNAFEEEGSLVSARTYERTLSFLYALPREVPLPDIFVESETAIGLDWDESNRRVVSVTVDDSPRVGFASLIGQASENGRIPFADGAHQIPPTIRTLLARIYPEHTTRRAIT